MKSQLGVFKSNLEEFAKKYRKDINKDPVFRMHFQKMCTNIGVDPLASNKGFWAEVLGFGDFYYELGVQIAEVCLTTRDSNGGLIEIKELKRLVDRMRGRSAQDITEDDILRSIKNLKTLGNGFEVVSIGPQKFISSVPRELNVDFTSVLGVAQTTGFVTLDILKAELGWDMNRAQRVLDDLVKDGVCWVDTQAPRIEYWMASFLTI
ncbi:hypothetical protein SmJEL517_g04927 [Synchytrium microbalum]|uniref:Vacuolar-sorting protein SNF8 n=1 Tax=Synchytrium microbalum TaxID=1806994 RepID=A0A507C1A3_9FUNG|nr:uncharacterized protein SmJEL517_g04927 [Synchytrium microbalum]TPX31844.1 hypothetical protein SmJEL517_g04927 [Synchytrium microbalum]